MSPFPPVGIRTARLLAVAQLVSIGLLAILVARAWQEHGGPLLVILLAAIGLTAVLAVYGVIASEQERRAQEELSRSMLAERQRFRTLFRAAPDAVLTVLEGGQIREANDAVRDVIGVSPTRVVGRRIGDLVASAHRPALSEALERAFAGLSTRLEVCFHAAPDLPRRFAELAVARVPGVDPPSVLVVGRDVTMEREMRQRLMESDRLAAVGELVAGVAHEVNNPLSSISAYAQLLLRDADLSEVQRESLDVIRSETQRASQVVRDLLAFARRSEPEREPLDLNTVVTRTLRLRSYELTSNKVEVDSMLAAELPAVIGDARQVQQVCLNLVTNAMQAMASRGGGRLAVTTREEGSDVVLEMRDTGVGIPERARARIFEPFFTTKPEGQGTGLGLSVSYGIVTAHGGTIQLVDTSDQGTTFRVMLPAVADVPSEVAARVSGSGLYRSPLAGIRLLFVDDEAALRSSMEAFGELRGFTVIGAANGSEALAVIERTGLDAIVCDLRMPGMDGQAFFESLGRERPGLAARTVFITGDVVTAAYRPPGWRQPIVNKPFTFERLEEALIAVMRGAPFAASTPAAGGRKVRG